MWRHPGLPPGIYPRHAVPQPLAEAAAATNVCVVNESHGYENPDAFSRGLEKQFQKAEELEILEEFSMSTLRGGDDWLIRVVSRAALHAAAGLLRRYKLPRGIQCRYSGYLQGNQVLPIHRLYSGDDAGILQFDWSLSLGPHEQVKSTWIALASACAWDLPPGYEFTETKEGADYDYLGDGIPVPEGWEETLAMQREQWYGMRRKAISASHTAAARCASEMGVPASHIQCRFLGQQQQSKYAQDPAFWTAGISTESNNLSKTQMHHLWARNMPH